MINDYISLSTRAGFNKSLAHFRMVTDIVRRIGQGENLAEIVDGLEKQKTVEKGQIGPILNAIVIDRMNYATRSFNLPHNVQEFGSLCAEVQKWNRLDVLLAYHHPQLGITLINPKLPAHWEAVGELAGNELVVLYVRALEDGDHPLEPDALSALQELLIGHPVKGMARFAGPMRPKPAPTLPPRPAAAPAPAARPAAPAAARPAAPAAEPQAAPPPPPPSGGKVRMTPKYSVQVSNELFHNGNVEAWKNIVESYKTKYPGLEVHIFHDGQKVNNINSLFKWGKVKHGDVIVFCVSGEEIKGVAKLQRYLYEGASIRFENFLKKDVNKVLNLF